MDKQKLRQFFEVMNQMLQKGVLIKSIIYKVAIDTAEKEPRQAGCIIRAREHGLSNLQLQHGPGGGSRRRRMFFVRHIVRKGFICENLQRNVESLS